MLVGDTRLKRVKRKVALRCVALEKRQTPPAGESSLRPEMHALIYTFHCMASDTSVFVRLSDQETTNE